MTPCLLSPRTGPQLSAALKGHRVAAKGGECRRDLASGSGQGLKEPSTALGKQRPARREPSGTGLRGPGGHGGAWRCHPRSLPLWDCSPALWPFLPKMPREGRGRGPFAAAGVC